MSLTCHEEIGRIGRVGRGCYEETALVKFKLYRAALNTPDFDITEAER